MASNTALVTKDGMVKVCRLIDRKYYCIEFNSDVLAKDIIDYWDIDDAMFQKLGRPTKVPIRD